MTAEKSKVIYESNDEIKKKTAVKISFILDTPNPTGESMKYFFNAVQGIAEDDDEEIRDFKAELV